MFRKILIVILSILVLSGCAEKVTYSEYYSTGEAGTESHIELIKLEENVWMHRTYMTFGDTLYPANGLLAFTKDEILLIDTPWNDEQTESLLELVNDIFERDQITTIITHAHDDTMGGIGVLLDQGMPVYSTQMTFDIAKDSGRPLSQVKLESERTHMTINNLDITCFYPGGGHTEDNIVVYLNDYDILFAGCLIKELENDKIGNVADANVREWANSIQNVAIEFPDAVVVIPGHGDPGGIELLEHTIKIVENYNSK